MHGMSGGFSTRLPDVDERILEVIRRTDDLDAMNKALVGFDVDQVRIASEHVLHCSKSHAMNALVAIEATHDARAIKIVARFVSRDREDAFSIDVQSKARSLLQLHQR